MSAIDDYQTQVKPSLRAKTSQQGSVTQIRIQLQSSDCYLLKAIFSKLRYERRLIVNVTGTRVGENARQYLDLEIQGTISQISHGLSDLQSLNLKIKGKPNAEGDSWYC